MKTKSLRKILGIILGILLLVVVLAVGGTAFAFRNELKSMSSLKKVDDNVLYTMTYAGDYGFDEFLEQGASADQELVDFIIKKLLKGLPLHIDIPNLGCSTFQAQLEDGDRVFGRNFDLSFAPALFVKTTPDNGYASLSMVNLGFLGFNEEKLPDSLMRKVMTLAAPYIPLDGINEKGLTIGVLKIADEPTNQETDKIDITTTTAIRMILDKAATVKEAVELLQQYDMHSSANSCYHFHITDAAGASAIVEYVDNEFVLLPAEGSYQAATNFLLSPKKYNFGTGQDRYEILDTTLKASDGILADEDAAMQLLEDVSQEWHTTASGALSATQWSVVYNNTDLSAEVIVGMQYDKDAHTFSLKDFK